MIQLAPSFICIILPYSAAASFISNFRDTSSRAFLLTATQKTKRESAFPEAPDILRARDCAEHFGKCSLDEIEEIKSALHADRLLHMADEMAGYKSDLKPEDEIDRLILEEELTKQANLLKEAAFEAGEFLGHPPQAMDSAIALHHSDANQGGDVEREKNETENIMVDQIKSFSFLDSEITETIMICITVAALMTIPQLLLHS